MEEFLVVTAEQRALTRAAAFDISEFAVFDIELLPLDGGPETRGVKPRDIATRARSARVSTRTERRAP